MKNDTGKIVILSVILVLAFVFVDKILTKKDVPSPIVVNSPSYTNDQYGFSIELPLSWKGNTVIQKQWEGRDISSGKVVENGPIITLRHPQWMEASPREDMPIMIFTNEQWAKVTSEQLSLGAAPIPPSILGKNSKYVMALPARYNFDYKTGFEEVDQLVHTLKAYEPK